MDAKITALAANTTPASTDLTVIVDDPGGTPATQKMTVDTLDDYLSASTKTLTNKTLTSPKIDDIVAATVDHITLTPGASKLVKVAVLEQSTAGTNTYRNNAIILTGYKTSTVGSGAANVSGSVTFGITFTTSPVAIAQDTTINSAFATEDENTHVRLNGVSTTSGFSYKFTTKAGVVADDRIVTMNWIAIGTL